MHTSSEKVQAVLNAPPPTDLGELQSFLGLVNYYRKLIRYLSYPSSLWSSPFLRGGGGGGGALGVDYWCWEGEDQDGYLHCEPLPRTTGGLY